MYYCCIMPFLPAIGDSVIANTPNVVPKEYNKTVFTSEVSHGAADQLLNGAIESYSVPKDPSSLDMVSPAKGTDVEAPSFSDNAQCSLTPDVSEDGVEKDTNLEEANTESLAIFGQFSASGNDMRSGYTKVVTH